MGEMRKVGIVTTGIACAVCLVIGVSAAGIVRRIQAEIRPDFQVVIDGVTQEFKNAQGEPVYPILYDRSTYLPLRAIGELMGKTVYWYEENNRIELKDNQSLVTDADVIVPGSSSPNAAANISLEQAKQIALNKAGLTANDVTFTKTKTDTENGIAVYELEFQTAAASYSADIKLTDGSILSWNVDNKPTGDTSATGQISLEQAKQIALEQAGLSANEVVFTKAELDTDYTGRHSSWHNTMHHTQHNGWCGNCVYEIEFVKNGVEYSAEIRASDGAVLSWEVDR